MVDKPDRNDDSNRNPKPKGAKILPLRILIIEPSNRYCRNVWCALFNGLSHVLIGAVVMTVLFYSLVKKDLHASLCTFGMRTIIFDPGGEYWNIVFCSVAIGLCQIFIGGTLTTVFMYMLHANFSDIHIFLCTFGFHFFAAEAILSLNYANGWSTPLRLRHRRFTHVFLQICGLTCVFIGTVIIVTNKGIAGHVHGVVSLAATLLACITFLIGPFALLKGRYLKLLHTTFGIPTFIMSSISLCSGIYKSNFMDWSGPTVVYILTGFIFFYTSFIMASSFIKCMMRI